MQSPYAVHRPVANTYLVREHDRKRLRELLGAAAAVLLLGGGLFAYTWMHVETLRTGYRVDVLEKRYRHLTELERKWRLEVAFAAHPERIEERAKDELGMVTPKLDQMIFYEEIRGDQPGQERPGHGRTPP